jgi:hypothetical protein
MANIQHAAIPEAYLHESKGVSTALNGQVYITDGLGSGSWKYLSKYGELYMTGAVTAQALTATAARIDPGATWVAGESANITLNAADGTFTITQTDKYSVDFWCSFNTDAVAAGTLYTFYYAIDGVISTRSISVQKLTAGVDRLNAGSFGIAALTAGQVISIYAKSSINSTITPVEAGFNLQAV